MRTTDLLQENAGPEYSGPVLTDPFEVEQFLQNKCRVNPHDLLFTEQESKVGVSADVDFGGLKIKSGICPVKFDWVTGSLLLNDCNLKTLENLPSRVSGNLLLHRNPIESLKGCPSKVGNLNIGNCKNLKSFDEKVMVGKLVIRGSGITSLRNIHKFLSFDKKYIGHGIIYVGGEEECQIRSNVLGLLLVDGIKMVCERLQKTPAPFGPWEIINKYLKNLNDDSIYECQEELVVNGFHEYAQL